MPPTAGHPAPSLGTGPPCSGLHGPPAPGDAVPCVSRLRCLRGTPRPACPLPAQRSLPPAPRTCTLSSPTGLLHGHLTSHVSWLRLAWLRAAGQSQPDQPSGSSPDHFPVSAPSWLPPPQQFLPSLLCRCFLFQTGALAQSSGPFSQRGPSRTVRRPRMDTPTISSPKLPRPSDFLRPQSLCYLHMGYQTSQGQHVLPGPGPQPAHSPPPQAPGNLYSTS